MLLTTTSVRGSALALTTTALVGSAQPAALPAADRMDTPRPESVPNAATASTVVGLEQPRVAPPAKPAELRVLTLNIQVDAGNGRLPGIVDLIRQSRADVIGLQEVDRAGEEIARQLGFHYIKISPNGDTVVLSRYPLTPPSPGGRAVALALPNGERVSVTNLHLQYAPYQPFQLLHIPYEGGRFIDTEEDAIDEARRARGAEVDAAIAERQGADPRESSIFLGDFNEPDDWTSRAVAAGRHPLPVHWPAVGRFHDAGYSDAYRSLHPDEVANPGFTWSPQSRAKDPNDHQDRIDFVLYKGRNIKAVSAQIVGESAATSELVVEACQRPDAQPWCYPTDHRGVLVTFRVGQSKAARDVRQRAP